MSYFFLARGPARIQWYAFGVILFFSLIYYLDRQTLDFSKAELDCQKELYTWVRNQKEKHGD